MLTPDDGNNDKPFFTPGVLLVSFIPEATEKEIVDFLDSLDLIPDEGLTKVGSWYLLAVPPGKEEETLNDLKTKDLVSNAELDYNLYPA